MFWQKGLALFGLLAAVGHAAPPASGEIADIDMQNDDFVYFRADE